MVNHSFLRALARKSERAIKHFLSLLINARLMCAFRFCSLVLGKHLYANFKSAGSLAHSMHNYGGANKVVLKVLIMLKSTHKNENIHMSHIVMCNTTFTLCMFFIGFSKYIMLFLKVSIFNQGRDLEAGWKPS